MIVSSAHQVRTVSLTVRPKNSLNSQKPGSLGGLKMREPAPVASTISSGLAPVAAQIGAAELQSHAHSPSLSTSASASTSLFVSMTRALNQSGLTFIPM